MLTASNLTVNGGTVRLWLGGSGQPVVLLHGWTGIESLMPLAELLSEHCQVILPEHPGFGQSELPTWVENVGDMALHLHAVVHQLGLKPFHLVGHSLGGWIAAEYAVHHADRLRSLTLIDSYGLKSEEAVPDIFLTAQHQLGPLLWFDPTRPEAQPPTDPDGLRTLNRNLVAAARLMWVRGYNPKLKPWLGLIDAPTMLVWGESDLLVPPSTAAAWQAAIPNVRGLEIIARSGHLAPLESPALVAQCVSSFIKGV